jgi:hypothetical protein
MNTKFIRSIVFAVALLVGDSAVLSAAESSKEDAATTTRLITALMKSDYEAFLANGEGSFVQIKREQFEAASAQIRPKLQAGHEVSYLGELQQKGFRVTLWRIRFKDGSDDALASLSMKADKVGGFWIR